MVEIHEIEIERPDTVFGKHSFIREQWEIFRFTDFVTRGAALIDPSFVGIDILEPVIERLPWEKRVGRINKFFGIAKKKLEELGV